MQIFSIYANENLLKFSSVSIYKYAYDIYSELNRLVEDRVVAGWINQMQSSVWTHLNFTASNKLTCDPLRNFLVWTSFSKFNNVLRLY